MQNYTIKSGKGNALAFSIGLHMALGIIACTLSITKPCIPQPTSYQIALRPTHKNTIANKKKEDTTVTSKKEAPTQASNKNKKTTTPARRKEHTIQKTPTQNKKIRPTRKGNTQEKGENEKRKQKKTTIDQRGLHTGNSTPKKEEGGPLLELAGWKWDTVPEPEDTTDESGKIVFEIKVDAFGDIVSIIVLEKTVTPIVEQIYQEALEKLTFSKTLPSHTYAAISTGKVTFLIQSK